MERYPKPVLGCGKRYQAALALFLGHILLGSLEYPSVPRISYVLLDSEVLPVWVLVNERTFFPESPTAGIFIC